MRIIERKFQTLLFGLLVSFSTGYVNFALTECESSPDKLVSITNVALDRYPITIPGHVSGVADVTINRPVTGDLSLDVWVQSYMLFSYFTLPCISRVGSCTYDVCPLLDWFLHRGCPWQLQASNFPCRCPFENGTYSLSQYPFYIRPVYGPWAWIAFGDFRVTGRLRDRQTNTVVACYTAQFTVQEYQPTSIWDMWT